MPYEVERRIAVEAVLRACRLCRAVQADLIPREAAKEDRSPVTVADFGAQALVAHHLRVHLPGDPLIGEEDALLLQQQDHAPLRASVTEQVRRLAPELDERMILAAIDRGGYAGGAHGRHWALDPIDGTKGFLRREQYAVALALIEEGRVVLGVLGCPNLWPPPGTTGSPGFVFVAVRGEGSFARALDGGAEERLRVSSVADPARAVFCESVEAAHSSHGDAAHVATLLGVSAPPLRLDSQAKYACVARGEAAIYLRLPTRKDYQEKVWDHAAGAIVIEEAGGRVSDCRGAPLDFSLGRTLRNNAGVVASNSVLHERVLSAVQTALHL